MSDIYSIIDEEMISLKNVIAPSLTLCGWNVSHFFGKSSTFLRSKSGKINNKKKSIKLYDIVLKLTLQLQHIDQSSSSNLQGKYRENLPIKQDISIKL